MKDIDLTAGEAAKLRDRGWVVAYRAGAQGLRSGDSVRIREPWARLRPPEGASGGGEVRYILEADKTAEPIGFQYEPAETMPPEAAKRWGQVRWTATAGGSTLLYIVKQG